MGFERSGPAVGLPTFFLLSRSRALLRPSSRLLVSSFPSPRFSLLLLASPRFSITSPPLPLSPFSSLIFLISLSSLSLYLSLSLLRSLDYDKYSDFDDVQGHWHLLSLSPTKTRVFYAADLKLRGKVPGPIMTFLSKVALKESTGWVKKESEKTFGAEGPAESSLMTPE